MRDSKIYKTYCGVGKNHGLSVDFETSKGSERRVRETEGHKDMLIEKSNLEVFFLN